MSEPENLWAPRKSITCCGIRRSYAGFHSCCFASLQVGVAGKFAIVMIRIGHLHFRYCELWQEVQSDSSVEQLAYARAFVD